MNRQQSNPAKRWTIVATACCYVIAITGFSSVSAADTNVMCPVMQDQQASTDYAITYKGQEIRFCCSECAMEFEKNPEAYETAVPQLQNMSTVEKLQLFITEHSGLVISIVLLMVLIALKIRRMRQPITEVAVDQSFFRRRISPAIPLLGLCGYLGYEVYSLHDQLNQKQMEEEIHFATFYDFGYPPTPARPETETRLSASFYRGNDERSPKLFNNGNYRTAKFNVSLCDASREEILPGENVKGKDLL